MQGNKSDNCESNRERKSILTAVQDREISDSDQRFDILKAVHGPSALQELYDSISGIWYLQVTGNRYLPRGSNENALFITSTGNVDLSVSRWVITLVTIPLLEFVMIH